MIHFPRPGVDTDFKFLELLDFLERHCSLRGRLRSDLHTRAHSCVDEPPLIPEEEPQAAAKSFLSILYRTA